MHVRAMSIRTEATEELSVKQRLTLFHGTSLNAEQVLSMSPEEVTFEALLSHNVKAVNIVTAGIRPVALKRMGVAEAAQFRRLGFDALHLVDPVLCTEANAAYGATALIEVFLVQPSDAVAFAGSEAMEILGLQVQQLLETCAGSPIEAQAVLQQISGANPIKGIQANTLLDTGLRASQLRSLGITPKMLAELPGAGNSLLSKLGFTL